MRTLMKFCLFIFCFVVSSSILEAKERVVHVLEDLDECQKTTITTSLPNDAIYLSACDSWITVARCVKVRKCWVGVTSNGTKYGVYWQNKFDCR